MRKFLATLALGAAATAVVPAATAFASEQSELWRGHFTVGGDCYREGNRILMTSPRAQTFRCKEHPLGGFDLYVTY
jgi:hypothetical protein